MQGCPRHRYKSWLANCKAVQYVCMLCRIIDAIRLVSELIVFMHYVGLLITLPCPRVTFCCVVLETRSYTCANMGCTILLSLLYSWCYLCCKKYKSAFQTYKKVWCVLHHTVPLLRRSVLAICAVAAVAKNAHTERAIQTSGPVYQTPYLSRWVLGGVDWQQHT